METETLAIFIPLTLIIATAIVVYVFLSNRNKNTYLARHTKWARSDLRRAGFKVKFP